jgi:YfiH family protein
VRNAPDPRWIVPDWPAAPGVRALITTRAGGVSAGNYASLNLGTEVGDDPACVARNRAIVGACLPGEPKWLKQVDGIRIIEAEKEAPGTEADGAIVRDPGVVCAVLTADCVPVLLCDRAGGVAAVAHAGWRGLAAGIVERVVRAMGAAPRKLLAYLGPGIGPRAYEIGEEIRRVFIDQDPVAAEAFAPRRPGKYLADLYGLARRRLAAAGVVEVYGGGFCTASEERFFSYRRDGTVTGRMASFVWLEGRP